MSPTTHRGRRPSSRRSSSARSRQGSSTRSRAATSTPSTIRLTRSGVGSTRSSRTTGTRFGSDALRFSPVRLKPVKLALAQVNPVVGDLDGNRELIIAHIREARDARADLVVLPELAVTGYPPEDLLLRPGFVRAAQACVEAIAAEVTGIVALVGTPLF